MAERVSQTKRVQEVVQGTGAYLAMGVGVCARAPCNHKGVEWRGSLCSVCVFFFLPPLYGCRILVPQLAIEPWPSAVNVQSLNQGIPNKF